MKKHLMVLQQVSDRARSAVTPSRVGFGLAALVLSMPAFAAIDVTALTAVIAEAVTAVTAVGLAVFGVIGLIAALKWVRRAL